MSSIGTPLRTQIKVARRRTFTLAALRFKLETTLGAHGLAKQVEAFGWSLGLDVRRLVSEGWFFKTHWFTVRGGEDELLRFADYVDALIKVTEGEDDSE